MSKEKLNGANANHNEREHALCSASGAERWMACPGSVALCELLPKRQSSKAADEGTQAHELAEKILTPLMIHWNKAQKNAWKESEMMDFTIYDNYPREMWEHCVGYARLIYDNVLHYKPKKFFIERRVTLSKDLAMFGTADCYFAFRENGKIILSVWDLKYGKGKIVEATDLQFPYYASAVQEEIKDKAIVDEFWLNVYQPRAYHEEGSHRMAKIGKAEMEKTKKAFFVGAKKAMAQVGKPVPQLTLIASDDGQGHCQFCDAMAICPAFAEKMNSGAGMDFADDPELLLPATDEFRQTAQNLIEFDKERFAKLLRIEPLAVKFFSTLKETGINYMLSGGDVPGWKVVETRGKRGWKKETGNVARGLKVLGIENPYDDKLRGLGSIETELKDKGIAKTKNQAADLIASLVEKSQGGYTLAPEDDPRPKALGHEKAADAFDAIPVEAQDEFVD